MKPQVLIASPVRQKPAVLRHYLDSLSALDRDGFTAHYLFIDNNDDPASQAMLADFQQKNNEVTVTRDNNLLHYHRDDQTHYWNDTLVDRVGAMKDRIIAFALDRGYDGLFLVDSDLLLHPNTLSRLMTSGKPIISNIFWTSWQKDTAPLPQVWMMDEYTFYQKNDANPISEADEAQKKQAFLRLMRTPGVYEVGGLGACTYIKREALERGLSFKRLPNVSFWGEDRHFCVRAAALGIPLFVDTRYPAYHLYRDADLEGVDRFKRSIAGLKTGITVSLCMIVRNEEASLGRCLASIAGIADEIIIVDTGSTDRTKEIARAFTDKIVDFTWIDDFGAARNYAFSQATQDYILWLDADDVLKEADRQQFMQLKQQLDPDVDSVMMHYHLAFDGSGKPTVSLKRNRLVKRSRGFVWIGAVHEYLEVAGRIIHSDIAVTHSKERAHSDRNLLIYRRRAERGEVFSPRDLFYYANELKDHAFFEEAAEQYETFLATKQGWVEDQISACLKLADCYGRMCERELQLRSLFRSMDYDRPRAEACCGLGALFFGEERLMEAVYWYEAATKLGPPPQTGTIINHAYWSWLPHLQLCVCYDRLGQHQLAYDHNELALQMCPGHNSMLANKAYLEKQLGKKDGESRE